MVKLPDRTSIRLRPVEVTDWPRVHEWAQREEVCRFLPWGPNTPEQTRDFVASAAESWRSRPQTRYVWVALAGDVVGIGELRHQVPTDTGVISYAVHHRYWGKGIGSSTARLLRDFGFEELRLHRIEATCDPRNVASERIIRSIGLTYEGTIRQHMLIRGDRRDSHAFGMLRQEWLSLNPASVAARVAGVSLDTGPGTASGSPAVGQPPPG